MEDVRFIKKETLDSLANAVRTLTGGSYSDKYSPEDMPQLIIENSNKFLKDYIQKESSTTNFGSDVLEGITRIGAYAFRGWKGLGTIDIPEGVTKIENYAFYGCSNLYRITLPESLTTLSFGCFRGCEKIRTISLPSALTIIQQECFKGCTRLSYIVIPDNVTQLGYYSFEGCTSLEQVTLGRSLSHIGKDAFKDCTNLKWVYLNCSSVPSFYYSDEAFSSDVIIYVNEDIYDEIIADDDWVQYANQIQIKPVEE